MAVRRTSSLASTSSSTLQRAFPGGGGAAGSSSPSGSSTKPSSSSSTGPFVSLYTQGLYGQAKVKKGAYIPVNANNDNGSKLTNHLPIGPKAKRDFDVAPDAKEKSLVKCRLIVRAPGIANPSVRLSATSSGRAVIKVWDTAHKDNQITLPKTWTLAQMPEQVYVEGVVTGAAEREVDMTLELLDGGGGLVNLIVLRPRSCPCF